MRDYGTPEGLPTPDEMWAKLTGQKTVTYETEQNYSEVDELLLLKWNNGKFDGLNKGSKQ